MSGATRNVLAMPRRDDKLAPGTVVRRVPDVSSLNFGNAQGVAILFGRDYLVNEQGGNSVTASHLLGASCPPALLAQYLARALSPQGPHGGAWAAEAASILRSLAAFLNRRTVPMLGGRTVPAAGHAGIKGTPHARSRLIPKVS